MNSHRLKIDSLSPGVRSVFSRLAPALPIPFLRLRGRWLERAGFVVGASVQVVVVSPGRLVVEVIESEPRQR
jgi:Toxin SymE, type I toxin-antitoxin system